MVTFLGAMRSPDNLRRLFETTNLGQDVIMGPRLPLILAILLLAGGLTLAVLMQPREIGILVFSLGVINLGYYFLLVDRDRTMAMVLIFIGAISAAADVVRLVLISL